MMLAARPHAKGAALSSVVVKSLAPGFAARTPARLLSEPRGSQSCRTRNSTMKVCRASCAFIAAECMRRVIIREDLRFELLQDLAARGRTGFPGAESWFVGVTFRLGLREYWRQEELDHALFA